jgi:hypothetical protein
MRRLAPVRSESRALTAPLRVGRVSPSTPPFSRWWTVVLCAGVLLACTGASAQQPVDQATAKIQFMHYVAQYAVWPKEAFASHNKEFVLGVLGDNPFGETLQNYFKGKSVKTRAFVVKFFKTVEEIKDCQMLFISSSEKSRFGQILGRLDDASILTISDSDGFLQKNGMIFMFITAKSEITGGLGWDINPQAMKRAGLQIDPFFIEKARKPDH